MKKLFLASFAFLCGSAMAQDLYDISTITEINITFQESNWDALMDTYYSNDQDELLYGSCTINGDSFDSVGVAFKGNSTYNANNLKNPLKIKLADIYSDQQYHGCKTLKLATGDKDPSFVREVLSYEIGRKYMEMPLSNYAKVSINGNYYGLFVSSESVNGDFMEDRFYCHEDNTRLKCNPESVQDGSSLKYLGADSSLYFNYYELKSNYGWNDLVNICNEIQSNISSIEDYLDVDRALWMLAFNNVMVNLDSYTGPFRQNYYLIMDDNQRMNAVIWDLNQSIGSFSMIDLPMGPPSPTTLSDLTDMDPWLREGDTDFPLIYYLFTIPRYKKMYLAHCRTILFENISNGWYYTRAQELQQIIDAEVQNEPNGVYTYAQFTGNLNSQQGGGMGGGFYGISEVMDGRNTYLASHADFNLLTPTITNVGTSPAIPSAYELVTFSADIQDATYAYLGFRSYKGNVFEKIEMFDDGLHNDGAAGDDIWAVELAIDASDLQYYVYAENADAGMFSPERAEHEFYTLSLSAGVVINEIMAKNIVTATDNYGEYDDWIELYNNSASTVDLSGYMLEDTTVITNPWVFPAGTMIGPGEYLIVWADNDEGTQTGLHTNFKLAKSGETLIFADASGMIINSVEYPLIADNGTYGRYPNGTGGFIPMYATYNAENSFTTVSLDEEPEQLAFKIYPNPTSDYFNLSISDSESYLLRVYNIQGQKVFESTVSNSSLVDVTSWSKGAYIVTVPELDWATKMIVQ